jgi:hypothetical protein
MTAARFAREIERRWHELHGGPVVLSPADWSVLRAWYEIGVPLAIVDEAIAAVTERRRVPRSLSRLDAGVRAAWATVRDGRAAPSVARDLTRPAALDGWQVARDAAEPGSRLSSLLERLARRVAGGEDPAEADRELDRELAGSCRLEIVAEVERDVDRELARYRERIDPAAFARARKRAVTRRLRARLELPRLSS